MLSIKSNDQINGLNILPWMRSYTRRQQFRRMAMSLLAEKDDVLSDLGYERRHLYGAMNLPLRSDAARYLEQHRRV